MSKDSASFQPIRRDSASDYAILLCGAFGFGLCALLTRWGVGINADSVLYVTTAQNLLAGHGFVSSRYTDSLIPMTLAGPLYPMILAGFGFIGISIEVAARWLNCVLLGGNVALVGMLIRKHIIRGSVLPVIGSLFFLASHEVLDMHGIAGTEPLFVLLTLLGLYCLTSYVRKSSFVKGLVAGLFLSAALLDRYIGIAGIGVAGMTVALFGPRSVGKRLGHTVATVAIGLFPSAIWMFRNASVSGSTTGMSFSPNTSVAIQAFKDMIYNLSTFVLPWEMHKWIRYPLFLALLTLSFVLIWLAVAQQGSRESGSSDYARARPLFIVGGLFVLCYVCLIYVATLLLAHIGIYPFDRYLVPAFSVAVAVSVCAWHCLALRTSPYPLRHGLAVAVGVALLTGSVSHGVAWVAVQQGDGKAYASRSWKQSQLMTRARSISRDTPLWSNGAAGVLYFTGRPCSMIPDRYHLEHSRDDQRVRHMLDDLRTKSGLVLYFHAEGWRNMPTEQELMRSLPVTVVEEYTDGVIFEYSKPGEQAPEHTPTKR